MPSQYRHSLSMILSTIVFLFICKLASLFLFWIFIICSKIYLFLSSEFKTWSWVSIWLLVSRSFSFNSIIWSLEIFRKVGFWIRSRLCSGSNGWDSFKELILSVPTDDCWLFSAFFKFSSIAVFVNVAVAYNSRALIDSYGACLKDFLISRPRCKDSLSFKILKKCSGRFDSTSFEYFNGKYPGFRNVHSKWLQSDITKKNENIDVMIHFCSNLISKVPKDFSKDSILNKQ